MIYMMALLLFVPACSSTNNGFETGNVDSVEEESSLNSQDAKVRDETNQTSGGSTFI